MNTLEQKMLDLLIHLKEVHEAVELKAEFETEAVRMEELMRLKDIAEKAGMGIVIKIGGAEAVSNMFDAQNVGPTGIIAPMIESSYAMTKYVEAIKKYFPQDLRKTIHFGVNIETVQAYKNLNAILSVKGIEAINTVTFGRVDMSGSLGLPREEINSAKIFKIAQEVLSLAKKKGFRTTMGGGISIEAISFIEKLAKLKILDRFETRKIVFKFTAVFGQVDEAIREANKFELLWLENKKNYYSRIIEEDKPRIQMLKKRI